MLGMRRFEFCSGCRCFECGKPFYNSRASRVIMTNSCSLRDERRCIMQGQCDQMLSVSSPGVVTQVCLWCRRKSDS